VGVAIEASLRCFDTNGRLPANANELADAMLKMKISGPSVNSWFDPKSHNAIDLWKTPLKVQVSTSTFSITSAGPDRLFGTRDDIIEVHDLPESNR